MKLIIGDNTGLIKNVQVENESVVCKYGEQGKYQEIMKMVFSQDEQGVFAVNRENVIDFHCFDEKYDFQYSFIRHKVEGYDRCVGLNLLGNDKVVLNFEDGKIVGLNVDFENGEFIDQQEIFDLKFKQVQNGKVNGYRQNEIGILSKGTPVRLFDLNKQQVSFKPRNVKNDYLDLQVPIYDSDIKFTSEHTFMVGTAHSQLRYYDVRAKKQAIEDYEIKVTGEDKSPLVRLEIDHQQKNIIWGDNRGNVYFIDKQNISKNQINKKLRCGGSSVQDLVLHRDKDYIAVVGLDRVFGFAAGVEQLSKIYLKHQLKTVLMVDEDYHEDYVATHQKVDEKKRVEIAKKLKKRKTMDLYPSQQNYDQDQGQEQDQEQEQEQIDRQKKKIKF